MAAVLLLGTGPPAPIPLAPGSPADVRRGAFHIHTVRSDGTLPRDDVAAAAARAGLDFAIFTDHGDGTRTPEPPAYLHGVLCIDGVEISTNDGHYIALGISQTPYPLGGDADAVVEDVARLGGFGVAAHPTSPRADLAWSDWSVPIDGLEWLNADSEWRDESWMTLARAFIDYVGRPPGALARLLDRPERALATWDGLTGNRRVVGLAGHDAHGGFGPEGSEATPRRRLHVPSYEASFRTFALYVATGAAPTGEAATDAARLLDAIRGGRVFTAIDAIATPAALDFRARAGEAEAAAGGDLPFNEEPAQFSVRASAPPGARTRLLRNGEVVAEADGGALDHRDARAGAYRVEVHVPTAPGDPPVPWLVSNPIYRLPSPVVATRTAEQPTAEMPLTDTEWRVESSPASAGSFDADAGRFSLSFRLDRERAASPFVALATALERIGEGATDIVFTAAADEPMRVSVQLRFGNQAPERWGRSVYLDRTPREIRVPIDSLRRPGEAGGRPPVGEATSLLFVVDLTNARPGDTGRFTVSEVRLQEAGRPR